VLWLRETSSRPNIKEKKWSGYARLALTGCCRIQPVGDDVLGRTVNSWELVCKLVILHAIVRSAMDRRYCKASSDLKVRVGCCGLLTPAKI